MTHLSETESELAAPAESEPGLVTPPIVIVVSNLRQPAKKLFQMGCLKFETTITMGGVIMTHHGEPETELAAPDCCLNCAVWHTASPVPLRVIFPVTIADIWGRVCTHGCQAPIGVHSSNQTSRVGIPFPRRPVFGEQASWPDLLAWHRVFQTGRLPYLPWEMQLKILGFVDVRFP